MKYRNHKSNSCLGIILPISYIVRDRFVVIIDENNHLWYASKSVIDKIDEIKSFGLVFFRFDEDRSISYIGCCSENLYYDGTYEKSKLHHAIKLHVPLSDVCNVGFDFKIIKIRLIGRFNQYSLLKLEYFKNEADELCLSRYYLEDTFEKTYREFNNGFVDVIQQWFNQPIRMELPINGDDIKYICEVINKFNPYEVFESYKIEITYNYKTINRKELYSEEKTYSICYHDSYLLKWFHYGGIILYKNTRGDGYERVNSYQRFYDEEVAAKEKAYAEYNQQDHFDCLIEEYLEILNQRLDKAKNGNSNYPLHVWLPNYLKVKEVYSYLNENLNEVPRPRSIPTSFNDYKLSCFDKIFMDAIKQFNKTN